MTEKRFIDNGFEAIEDQSFTDIETNKTYYVDYFDEIIELVNELSDENKKLKSINQDHKDHLVDFYADYDRLEKENKQLKREKILLTSFIRRNHDITMVSRILNK